MEDEFVDAVSVLLPPGKLIVDGEGDTLFEATLGIGGEAKGIARCLQTESHVKVLGHVRFGPELLKTIVLAFVGRSILDSGPAKHGVVANEGRDISLGNGEGDGCVDEVGEPGDAGKE